MLKWVRVGCSSAVACQEQDLLATHRPSSILRRQVRVLSGSWALNKLISRFISILPLSSDDGFHIPQIGPPRSSQTTHTMRLHYRVGLLQRPHPRCRLLMSQSSLPSIVHHLQKTKVVVDPSLSRSFTLLSSLWLYLALTLLCSTASPHDDKDRTIPL